MCHGAGREGHRASHRSDIRVRRLRSEQVRAGAGRKLDWSQRGKWHRRQGSSSRRGRRGRLLAVDRERGLLRIELVLAGTVALVHLGRAERQLHRVRVFGLGRLDLVVVSDGERFGRRSARIELEQAGRRLVRTSLKLDNTRRARRAELLEHVRELLVLNGRRTVVEVQRRGGREDSILGHRVGRVEAIVLRRHVILERLALVVQQEVAQVGHRRMLRALHVDALPEQQAAREVFDHALGGARV